MKAWMLAMLLSTAPALAMDLPGIAKETALRYRLDPAIVAAVIRVESAWDAGAVSSKGALGLMQLMPATASDLGIADPLDPIENLEGGCRYLRLMLDRFGDLRLALAAYNAGPEAVSRAGAVPDYPETQAYVESVLRAAGRKPTLTRLAWAPLPASAVVSLTPSGTGIALLFGENR